jgi:hypothetical protein
VSVDRARGGSGSEAGRAEETFGGCMDADASSMQCKCEQEGGGDRARMAARAPARSGLKGQNHEVACRRTCMHGGIAGAGDAGDGQARPAGAGAGGGAPGCPRRPDHKPRRRRPSRA